LPASDNIREMKKEQAAYNAKMNAQIHDQLNSWIALREHVSGFSFQMKHIGTTPRKSSLLSSAALPNRPTNQSTRACPAEREEGAEGAGPRADHHGREGTLTLVKKYRKWGLFLFCSFFIFCFTVDRKKWSMWEF
jgi:hypothetical protein